jgi:hypothetical protein
MDRPCFLAAGANNVRFGKKDARPPKEGTVADRERQLVLNALSRAAAEAVALPLYASKTAAGLFPATAGGKQAAQRCCAEGYLQTTPAPAATSSRAPVPFCTLTDKGRAFLLDQLSPRQVLEDFVRALEARESQLGQLLGQVRTLQSGLESLRTSVAAVLDRIRQAEAPAPARDLNGLCRDFHDDTTEQATAVLQALQRWQAAGASEDCTLPELFRQVRASCPGVSLGSFHDTLRQLQDAGRIYLHPWTGPLYEVPEPPCSLLVGHEIAYYASIKEG